MRNSYIVYKVKMDYVSKIAFFGLKMMVKSGLDFFWNPSMWDIIFHYAS